MAPPSDIAIAELEGGADSRYYAFTFEAAIRLFRQQGFAFDD